MVAPEPPPAELPPAGPDEPPAYVTEGPPPEDEDDGLAAMPESFRAMVELFHARGEPVLSAQLAGSVHCVSYAPGRVDIRPKPGADPRLTAQMAAHLGRWTGQPWDIRVSRDEGDPTLREQAGQARAERFARAAEHPVVSKVLELFPGAAIEDITAPPPPLDTTGEADDDEEALDDADTVVLDDDQPQGKANQA